MHSYENAAAAYFNNIENTRSEVWFIQYASSTTLSTCYSSCHVLNISLITTCTVQVHLQLPRGSCSCPGWACTASAGPSRAGHFDTALKAGDGQRCGSVGVLVEAALSCIRKRVQGM